MKPENKKYLEEHRHFWITLRDAFYVKGLSSNIKENMLRIIKEEFSPNYSTDLWCGNCIAKMLKFLYTNFEAWEKQTAAIQEVELQNFLEVKPNVNQAESSPEKDSSPLYPNIAGPIRHNKIDNHDRDRKNRSDKRSRS